MEDKSAIYYAQILPLIERIERIVTEYDIPYIVVVQSSSEGYERSAYIPHCAHKEIRQLWAWLEQSEEE